MNHAPVESRTDKGAENRPDMGPLWKFHEDSLGFHIRFMLNCINIMYIMLSFELLMCEEHSAIA